MEREDLKRDTHKAALGLQDNPFKNRNSNNYHGGQSGNHPDPSKGSDLNDHRLRALGDMFSRRRSTRERPHSCTSHEIRFAWPIEIPASRLAPFVDEPQRAPNGLFNSSRLISDYSPINIQKVPSLPSLYYSRCFHVSHSGNKSCFLSITSPMLARCRLVLRKQRAVQCPK